jgi:hypothetical protein
LLLAVGGMLAIDLVFFEPIARLAIARAGARTQTELDFKSASGSLLLGRVVFEEVSAKRTSDSKSSFDLKARRLGIKADPWALLSRPVALKAVSVETVSGSLRMPERRRPSGAPATAEEQERIRLRRRFRIGELTLKDVNITLAKGGNTPVAVSLSSVSSAPFRGH